jgi:hypothetical protein
VTCNRQPETMNQRATSRRAVSLPARLAWKDSRGVNRFASVVTRDVSDYGVFVECQSSLSIPMYRLVQFQLEPTVREAHDVPASLRQGRVLSAVYRVSHATKAARPGVALRLMVDPRRYQRTADEPARATA